MSNWSRAKILTVAGAFGLTAWLGTGYLAAEHDKVDRLTKLQETADANLRSVLATQQLLLDAVDPQSCIARRSAYDAAVLVIRIINDNRAIHGEKPVPDPKKPADYNSCPTYAPQVNPPKPRSGKASAPQDGAEKPESRPDEPKDPKKPKPGKPKPPRDRRSLLCRILDFLPGC